MKTIKKAIAYVTFRPVLRVLFFLMVRINGFKRMTTGRVSVWGDERFLALVAKAFEELRILDEALYVRITSERKRVFYFNEKRSEQQINAGLFNINDEFVANGVHGVIARVVYAFFLTEVVGDGVYSKAEHHKVEALYSEAKSQTRTWLAKVNFTEQVIEMFK